MENQTDLINDFDHFVTPWNQRVSCAILFSVLSFGGMLSNATAISLSLFTPLRQRKINLFIANLAASDFMLSAVFLFGQNFYILYRESMPAAGCSWLAFMNFIAALQEFVFPPFLAINRYVGLYHQNLYDRVYTARNMAMMVAGSWTFSTAVPLAFALTGHTGFDRRNEHCCLVVEDDLGWSIAYWMIIIVPLLGMCDSTMVVCNWKIYKKLKEHGEKVKSATDDGAGSGMKKNVVSENREILYFMIIDMLMPICAHSVYHVSKFAIPNRMSLFSRQFFTCLYLGNSVIRGVIIVAMLRPYRQAFQRYVCRQNACQVVPVVTSTRAAFGILEETNIVKRTMKDTIQCNEH